MATTTRNGKVRALRSGDEDDSSTPRARRPKFEIKKVTSANEDSACISVYAKSGVGKTVLMATVLDWESIKIPKMFVIDTDGGLRSVRSRGDGIEYTPVTEWERFLDVRKELETGLAAEYGAIGLDTGSELADLAMEWTIDNRSSNDENRPNQLDWHHNSRMYITQVVRPLRNIGRKYGIPVVLTFWEREDTNDNGGVIGVRADLNPALRKMALAAVDLACWEEVMKDDQSRALHLTTTRRTDAKFRLDMALDTDKSIPPYIYNPSLATILDTIVDGKPWPEGKHVFPEGLTPRFQRVKTADAAVEKPERKDREARRAARAAATA